MTVKKDVAKILKKAEQQGWRVEDVGRRFKCYSPDGRTLVTVSKTPSSQNAVRAIVNDLKKGGFDPDA
jgi:hypothetical protein